jgi:hypothetical protein
MTLKNKSQKRLKCKNNFHKDCQKQSLLYKNSQIRLKKIKFGEALLAFILSLSENPSLNSIFTFQEAEMIIAKLWEENERQRNEVYKFLHFQYLFQIQGFEKSYID